jgi:predicted DNA repair protein MutK
MSGGLVALLDDVAVLARAAAASIDDVGVAAARAGVKAAGVVVDDTAVTPQYVRGLSADRELPIVRRIALGSMRNKLLIILPAVLVLSQFFPFLLTPLLMLGGAYLCYEGAEKVWAQLTGHDQGNSGEKNALPDEKTIISGAVRTDFILSAEIMVIALNEVTEEPLLARAVILAVVGVVITVLVYGVVALIVKMDDVGLKLAAAPRKAVARTGRGLVMGMPRLLTTLTVIGTAAMLWVGGHILLVGTEELGWDLLYGLAHQAEQAVRDTAGAFGGAAGWLVNTCASAVLGLIVGAALVLLATFTLPRRHARSTGAAASH